MLKNYFKNLLLNVQNQSASVVFSTGDQGLLSLSNFVVNILLARYLSIESYGFFSVIFAYFLFFSGFQNALVLEPVSVFGPAKYKSIIKEYFTTNFIINLLLALAITICFVIAAIYLYVFDGEYKVTLFFSLTSFFILIHWFLRRICYVFERPEVAFYGSVVYALLVFCGLISLLYTGKFSINYAIIVMSIGSFGASLMIQHFLKFPLNFYLNDHIKLIVKEHWKYSKWVLGSVFVHWLSSAFYLPMIASIIGTEATGSFKAFQNLFLPINQYITAMGLLLIPFIAKKVHILGKKWIRKGLLNTLILSFPLIFIYLLVVNFFGDKIIVYLYGNQKYSYFLWSLPYWCLFTFIASINQLLGFFFKAIQKPNILFYAQSATAIFSVFGGVTLVTYLGLKGALYSMLISAMIMSLMQIYCLIIDE